MPDKHLSFTERLKKLQEERGEVQPEKPQFDEDLIPDVYSDRTPEQIQMDQIIDNIGVLDAYRKWIGKEVDEGTTKKREGVAVSCPSPNHRDAHPSAWLNQDKNTWFCGGCQEGGDVYDLASIRFGIYDYKDDGVDFHKLREKMAESYGWHTKKLIDGSSIVYQEEETEDVTKANEDEPKFEINKVEELRNPNGHDLSDEEIDSTIAKIYADTEESSEQTVYPSIDWRNLVKKGTFLYEYCDATSTDDSPEEYHFWHGLLALGHAVGKNVSLDDTRHVYANMLICLLGGTGYGKTKSRHYLNDVIKSVMPFHDQGLSTTGVKILATPASGEYLIKSFIHEAKDPSLPKGSSILTSVNGIVDYDEFAALLARANRPGNTLKTTLMRFADTSDDVSTGSMTHGALVADNPFCSITASTQPRALKVLLTKTDAGSGFLNRWIFVGGLRKEKDVVGGGRSNLGILNLDVAKDSLKKVHSWGSMSRLVTFTDEGYETIVKLYRQKIFPMQESDDTDLLKRLDLLFKKLILIFCINERKTEVDAEIVNTAAELLDYVVQCYGIINDNIGLTLLNEIAGEISRHMRRHQEKTGRAASPRDLQRYMQSNNYPIDQIKKSLETMITLEMVEIEKPKTGQRGRPTTRYRLVI